VGLLPEWPEMVFELRGSRMASGLGSGYWVYAGWWSAGGDRRHGFGAVLLHGHYLAVGVRCVW
jgi:hypothetical protein